MSSAAPAERVCMTCGARYASDAGFCAIDGTLLRTPSQAEIGKEEYLGREILDHIALRSVAGVGAMGRVYRAHQRGIDRDVAVKILHRELSSNAELVTRFHREAKVASRLQHPNVVQVHLAGQLPDGAMYIVMEYLDGVSLQAALDAAGGAFALPRMLHVALQLCDAVGEAHAQGIVHRDLKPENVMLVHRAEDPDYVKVLDFGIARLHWGDQSMATAAGLIFGTARYISPEGAQGEPVTPASDVYSLATLFYQMLSGRTPFRGEQAVGLLIQQINDAPPPLKSVERASYVPDPIAEVIMQNLAKSAEHRAPHARALGRALLESAKLSGFAPEDLVGRYRAFARSAPVQIASKSRTSQFDVDPQTAAQMGAPSTVRPDGLPGPQPKSQKPAPSTTKWTPPAGFRMDGQEHTAPPTTEHASMNEPPGTGTLRMPPPAVARATEAGAPKTEVEAPIVSNIDPSQPLPPHREVKVWSEPPPPSRQWMRYGALVLLCFLAGAALTLGIAHRMGRLGASKAEAALAEDWLSRTHTALALERYIAPPGDNVRELVAEGQRRWPADRRFEEARTRAVRDVLDRAEMRVSERQWDEAEKWIKTAEGLEPGEPRVQALRSRIESEARPVVPPLTATRDAGPPSSPATPSAAKPVLEVTPAAPRPGQSSQLVARIVGRKGSARARVEGAGFEITGVGPAPVVMAAMPDSGGVFRVTYTFLRPGRYEAAFVARIDGVPSRATRTVVVDAPSETSPPLPNPTPSAAPTGSVRWL